MLLRGAETCGGWRSGRISCKTSSSWGIREYMIQGCCGCCGPVVLAVLTPSVASCCVGISPPLVPVVPVVLSMWFCSSPLWTLWLLWPCGAGGSHPYVQDNLCATVLSAVQTASRSGVSFLHRHRGAGSPYTRTSSIGHHALVVGHVTALV